MTEPAKRLPILVLDFDGVLHSYSSGWKGADVIPDPPVPGALEFVIKALNHFKVAIFSSRSNQEGGIEAMKAWLLEHLVADGLFDEVDATLTVEQEIQWPTEKPPAVVSIDDRALTFDGTWPEISDLLKFQPWNKLAELPALRPLSREALRHIHSAVTTVDYHIRDLPHREAVKALAALKDLTDIIHEGLPGFEYVGECEHCDTPMGLDERIDVSGGEGEVYYCTLCATALEAEVKRDGTDG